MIKIIPVGSLIKAQILLLPKNYSYKDLLELLYDVDGELARSDLIAFALLSYLKAIVESTDLFINLEMAEQLLGRLLWLQQSSKDPCSTIAVFKRFRGLLFNEKVMPICKSLQETFIEIDSRLANSMVFPFPSLPLKPGTKSEARFREIFAVEHPKLSFSMSGVEGPRDSLANSILQAFAVISEISQNYEHHEGFRAKVWEYFLRHYWLCEIERKGVKLCPAKDYLKTIPGLTLKVKVPVQVTLDATFTDAQGYLPLFYEYVRKCTRLFWSTADFYSAYGVLAQSSGYGKTRLIIELGKYLPVIPMCIRGAGENGEPARSHTANLFSSLTTELEMVAFIAAYLKSAALLYDAPLFKLQKNTTTPVELGDIHHRLTMRSLFGNASLEFSDSVTVQYHKIRQELLVLFHLSALSN